MARAPTAAEPIKVMLSSQCKRAFPVGGRTLTQIRQDIRDRLEGARLLDQPVFKVWINEDAPPAHLAVNSWDTCLDNVARADIVIVLSTGHAGSTRSPGDVGICHAELMRARDTAPTKVRLIPINGAEPLPDEDAASNARFADYLDQVNAFSPPVFDEASLMAAVDRAVMDAIANLVEAGAREGRKGRFDTGEALAWSKMGYDQRARAMSDTLIASLKEEGGLVLDEDRVCAKLGAAQVLFKISACPDALSVAASRERIGRPFLADHNHIRGVDPAVVGPVHLIACGGGATEAQARALLGFPDATIVRTRFGVFVADTVQKIQFALLRDCRDETLTRHALHRLLDWLRENQEAGPASDRAASRRRIVEAIGKEV